MIQNLIERKDYALDQIFKKQVSILYMPRKTNTSRVEKHALGFKVVNRITLMFGSKPNKPHLPKLSIWLQIQSCYSSQQLTSLNPSDVHFHKLPILLKTVSIFIVLHACFLSHLIVSDSLRPHYCSLPGFSVHGIFQARILEWVAISSSRGSSQPRDQTHISCIDRWLLYHWATWEAPFIIVLHINHLTCIKACYHFFFIYTCIYI